MTFGSFDLKAQPCWLSYNDLFILALRVSLALYASIERAPSLPIKGDWSWNVRDMDLPAKSGLVRGDGLYLFIGSGFVSCSFSYS